MQIKISQDTGTTAGSGSGSASLRSKFNFQREFNQLPPLALKQKKELNLSPVYSIKKLTYFNSYQFQQILILGILHFKI